MRIAAVVAVSGLMSMLAFQSCIFDADPVSSNSPPYIKDYSPEDLLLTITAPDDSIVFSFTAVDPDGDKLTCGFVLVDGHGDVIEVLCHESDYIFKPEKGGFYRIEGRAYDHSDHVARNWFVSAVELHNDPPVIDWYLPNQDSICTQKGSMIEFGIGVTDDHPEDLRFSFYMGSEPIAVLSEDPFVQFKFMENGFFDLNGMVWDGEFGDTLSWVVRVVEELDTIAPAKITDLIGWVGADPGTVRLQWTATGDDGMDGNAYRYLIRTHTRQILYEYDWRAASQLQWAPVPGSPGTTEKMTVGELSPASWVYVSIRAVDYFGNLSRLGNCIKLLAGGSGVVYGYIIDAATGAPLEGIAVSAGSNLCITSADGYYMLLNPDLSGDLIMLCDEDVVGDQGDYYDAVLPVFGVDWQYGNDLAMMPYFDLVSIMSGTYNESFYKFFREMTYTTGLLGRPTIFRNWNHFPLTIYNPPFSWEDVDIQDLAKVAMNSWNDLTGLELFIETTDPSAADVEIIYDTELYESKHHVEIVSLNEDGTPAKKLIVIYPNHQIAPIQCRGRRIFAHEMGHVLQLGHSYDLGHLMVGGTAPMRDDPSEDEINLIRSLYGLPTIFDANWYLDE